MRARAVALAFMAGLSLAAPARPALAAEGTQLRIATVAPAGSSFHKRLQSLGHEWSTGPGGVSMNIYAGTQGGEPQIVRRMRVGQIQGAMLTSVGLGQIDRSVTALQYLPLLFRDWDDVDAVRDKLRPQLEASLQKAGYVELFWGDGGWVRYFSKKPITKIGDLKSMRVYASSGEPETTEIFKNFYTPVVLEPDQILLGLRTERCLDVGDARLRFGNLTLHLGNFLVHLQHFDFRHDFLNIELVRQLDLPFEKLERLRET